MKEFRLEMRVKNNLLYRAIMDEGYATIREFCNIANIPYHSTCQLITMRTSPLAKAGKRLKIKQKNLYVKTVYKLCDALKKLPHELFTGDHIEYNGSRTEAIEIGANEIEAYIEMTRQRGLMIEQDIGEEISIKKDLPKVVSEVLATLTPRENKIVRMRFGIGMNSDYTLAEIGEQFDISSDRVRQIESNALRKIRHQSRSRYLEDFVNPDFYPKEKKAEEAEVA